MIAIRNSVRTLIELQTEDYPDSEIKAEQEHSKRTLYDTRSSGGLINSRYKYLCFFAETVHSLCFPHWNNPGKDRGKQDNKADMFLKRTIKPHTPVTSVDTAAKR